MCEINHGLLFHLFRAISPLLSAITRRAALQQPNGDLLQGCDSSEASSYLLRAPAFRDFSSSLHVAYREHVLLHVFTLDGAHIDCSIFQSLKSPVHGDAQRRQSGDDLAFVPSTFLCPCPYCSFYCLCECPCCAPLLLSPPARASTSSLSPRLTTSSPLKLQNVYSGTQN